MEDRLITGVHHKDAGGAEGVLGHARLVAGLTEQGCLLVAGIAEDRNLGAKDRLIGDAELPGGRKRLGKHAHRNPHLAAQLFVPLQVDNVVAHRARGVGIIGDMRFPPVSFQISQVSMLPNNSSPFSAFALAPST